jgi:hypothetical protein
LGGGSPLLDGRCYCLETGVDLVGSHHGNVTDSPVTKASLEGTAVPYHTLTTTIQHEVATIQL